MRSIVVDPLQDFIYWIDANKHVMRVARGGGEPMICITSPSQPQELLGSRGSFRFAGWNQAADLGRNGAILAFAGCGNLREEASGQFQPRTLREINGYLYWLADSRIMRKTGSAAAELVVDEYANSIVGDAERLYWGSVAGIRMAPNQSGLIPASAVSTLAEIPESIQNLWIDSTTLYVASRDSANSTAPSRISSVPLAGGQPKTLATAMAFRAIALDGDYIYWMTSGTDGLLRRLKKSGGEPETLVPVPAPGQSDSLAFDDHWIYFGAATRLLKWPKQ